MATRCNRRKFLKGAGALMTLAAHRALTPSVAIAELPLPQQGKNLFIINCLGGKDSQYSEPYRTQNLHDHILSRRPNVMADINLGNIISLNNQDIGLHQSWSPIQSAINADEIKIIQRVGINTPSGSHNDMQNAYSFGARFPAIADKSGWIRRLMQEYAMESFHVWGINTGFKLDFSGQSPKPPMVVSGLDTYDFRDLANLYGGTTGLDRAVAASRAIHAAQADAGPQRQKLNDALATMYDSVDVVQGSGGVGIANQFTTGDYGSSTIGANARDAAKFCRWKSIASNNHQSDNHLFYLNRGGFDTHSNQNDSDNLQAKLTWIAEAIRGLRSDLRLLPGLNESNMWDESVVLVISEFSRTLSENDGEGTDHGRSWNMIVAGGSVNGAGSNALVGPSPTVGEITGKNHIDYVIDFRRAYSEILDWMGFDPGVIFTEAWDDPFGESLNIFT